jgi:hypothetical protein
MAETFEKCTALANDSAKNFFHINTLPNILPLEEISLAETRLCKHLNG